jgi:hypothetical protein
MTVLVEDEIEEAIPRRENSMTKIYWPEEFRKLNTAYKGWNEQTKFKLFL